MVFIIQIVLAALGATLFLLLLYIFLKKHEQKKIRNKRIKTVSSIMGGDQKVPFIIEEHISRTYVLYYSYVVHTALNMFCKILGLIFSVASFAMQVLSDICGKCKDPYSSHYHPLMGISLSFLAVIFVIIIVYVKPHKRAAQYLNAWRFMNYRYYVLLIECGILDKQFRNEIDMMNKTEQSLSDDIDD